jgi:hypothetical protein
MAPQNGVGDTVIFFSFWTQSVGHNCRSFCWQCSGVKIGVGRMTGNQQFVCLFVCLPQGLRAYREWANWAFPVWHCSCTKLAYTFQWILKSLASCWQHFSLHIWTAQAMKRLNCSKLPHATLAPKHSAILWWCHQNSLRGRIVTSTNKELTSNWLEGWLFELCTPARWQPNLPTQEPD